MSMAAQNQPWEKRSDVLFWKGGLTHPAREAAVQSKTLKQAGLAQIDFVDYTGDLPSEFVSLPQHCHHKCAAKTLSLLILPWGDMQ